MDSKGVDPRLSASVARRVHILLAQGARQEFREQAQAFERERLKCTLALHEGLGRAVDCSGAGMLWVGPVCSGKRSRRAPDNVL